MEPSYVDRYPRLYREHWWWRAREDFLTDELRKLRLPGAPPQILDIGCGDGLFFPRLAQFGETWGVEPEPHPAGSDDPHSARIFRQPFDRLFSPGHKFGLILMLDVLEHLPDPEDALNNALRLLEPEGSIVITLPALEMLRTSHDVLNHHYARYDRAMVEVLARRTGFGIRSMRYFYHWLFFPKLAIRAMEAVFGATPRPPSVPPSWLNRMLYCSSRLEQLLTRRMGLVWGSSLLVVGGHT